MTAENLLQNLRHLAKEVRTLQEQVYIYRQAADGLKAMQLSDMPKAKGVGPDTADAIAKLVDTEKLCIEKILELTIAQNEATKIINCMGNSEHRNILDLRYIVGKSWDDIAVDMDMSLRNVHYLHGQAKRAFIKTYNNGRFFIKTS